MHVALRVAVLAALLGCASAERMCCMAMPACPLGFQSSFAACKAGESKDVCQTVSMCCTTLHCRRPASTFCDNQGPLCGSGFAKCKTGSTCTSDPKCLGTSCEQCCVRDPTPAPVKCDDTTEPLQCKEENECYNVKECKCGVYPQVRCFENPCNLVDCAPGHVCEASYCGGCHARCVADKPKCTPYTPPGFCLAQEGWCWNHKECKCMMTLPSLCKRNPCDTATCADGYVCEASYCGGCNHRCVAEPAKTPVPVVEPKGCRLGCGSFVPVGWSGADEGHNACNKCDCIADGALQCTEMGCQGLKGCSCTLQCGTVVEDGWQGNDEGSNECNTCWCMDGGLACTKIGCPDKPCPVPTTCNAYTKPAKCKAGECYNAGKCKCGAYPTVNCLVDPCMTATCKPGYTCSSSYCGGCNHRCVRDAAPTPVPEPSFCDKQGPVCGGTHPKCKTGYACMQDPTCDVAIQKCDSCCCRLPQCKPGHLLRKGKCSPQAAAFGLCYKVSNSCGAFSCWRFRVA